MKTSHPLPFLLSLLRLTPIVIAQTNQGFGSHPPDLTTTQFEAYMNESIISAYVPLNLGSGPHSFTFQVNISQIQGRVNASAVDVYTQYSILWSGDEDLNATLRDNQNLPDDGQPRLCASIPLGLFGAEETNGYAFREDNGSCVGALGQKCVDAWTNAGFGGHFGDCSSFANLVPDECAKKMPNEGGLGTGSILTNATQTSPAGFYYSTGVGDGSTSEAFERERNRLHMVLFTDQDSYHPVCLRAVDVKVKKGDPATAGAAKMSWSVFAAMMGVLVAFLAMRWE